MDAADNNSPAPTVRRFFLGAAVIGCLLLAVASVIPTFLGAEAAKEWFLSLWGAVAWGLFALVTAVGVGAVAALRRRLGLMAMHVGIVLVVAGALWGSEWTHRLRRGPLAEDVHGEARMASGYMFIGQGGSSREVFDEHQREIGHLPFDVHLEKFWIEYYDVAPDEPWEMTVWVNEGAGLGRGIPQWVGQRVEWKEDEPVELPLCDVALVVTEVQLTQYGEGPDAPVLPEMSVRLVREGRIVEQVLQPQPGRPELRLSLAPLYDGEQAWAAAGNPWLRLLPPRPVIKDFKSALVVRDGDRELARKTIEVNDPLHFGGYHFYQFSYDPEGGRYTVLSVVSDQGLSLVYAGFVLLIGGLVWHVFAVRRRRRPSEGGA